MSDLLERKRSYGIGGAGNIRSRADAMVKINAKNNSDGTSQRRRGSSLWSSSSSPGKGSIMDKLFRRNSKDEKLIEPEK